VQPPVRALRPYLWPLLAAAALLLCLARPATGHAAAPSQPITAAASAAGLDPSAGWHGRRIRRALRAGAPARRSTRTAWFDLAPGAGYATANGSPAVRMLQRRLRRLGYAVGPVDGHYGPRTRSAVGWFQLKHGLRADGVAGPTTQRRLQARVSGGAVGAPRHTAETDRSTAARPSRPAANQPATAAPPSRAPATEPATAAPPSRAPATDRATARGGEAARSSDRWLVAGLAVAAVLAVLAGIGGVVRLRRRRGGRPPEGTVVALAPPVWVAGLSPDPAIGRFAGTATATHVSPPAARADAPPVTRYRVLDDVTRRSVWVAAEEIQERRIAARRDVMHSRRRRGAVPEAAGRIARLHRRGLSADAIAELLNAESVPPPPGEAAWRPAVVAEYASGEAVA
jgi:hypothetical protein